MDCLTFSQEVGCHICNFYQDIKYRPDVTSQHGGLPQQNYPMQGYGGGGGDGGGAPTYK